MLKHKNILMGSIVTTFSIGVLLVGILVPAWNRTSSILNKTILDDRDESRSLIAKIITANSEQRAKNKAMEFYGLEIQKDDAIRVLEDKELKNKYDRAVDLGKYTFYNRKKYKIIVYKGKDSNQFKQILLVFKLKMNNNRSKLDFTKQWPANKIDKNQDEFALLYSFFNDKIIHGDFQPAKQKTTLKELISNSWFKEYEMTKLYLAFKAAILSKDDFLEYNMKSDSDETAKSIIKKYILSLVSDTSLIEKDLDDHVEFTKNSDEINKSSGTVSSTIIFNYKSLKPIVRKLDFTYIDNYKLIIKPGSESKVAEEVNKDDIAFEGETPKNVSIDKVEIPFSITDGTAAKITFATTGGTKPLVKFQILRGFTSYKTKIWEIVNAMNASNFASIENSTVLPSSYLDKIAILKLIHVEIDKLDTSFKEKAKLIIQTKSISFIPNDKTGILKIVINVGTEQKEIAIPRFLTQKAADTDAVLKVISAIKTITKGISKTTTTKIAPAIGYLTLNAKALTSLGWTGTTFLDTKGTTITYSHDGLTSNGLLKVTIDVAKGGLVSSTSFDVQVQGII